MLFGFILIFIRCLALAHGKSPSVNKLPAILHYVPPKIDPDLPKIPGIFNRGQTDDASDDDARRAIVGYFSDKDWATLEFLSMIKASFLYLTSQGLKGSRAMDLLVFAHPRGLQILSQLCTVLDLDDLASFHPRGKKPHCYVIPYPPPPQKIWHGYEFVNNVHFFADPRVSSLLTSNYEELMKTDFDCFLTPHLMRFVPERITFGIQEYALLPQTQARIQEVARTLGLVHKGLHNLGPAWLGPTQSIIDMANRSLSVLHHILTEEFEQLPGGGVKQQYMKGEGFPLWSAGMAAMYATEV